MKKNLLLFLLFFPVLSFAESKISKVTFTRQKDVVVIGYLMSTDKLKDVRVFLNSGDSSRWLTQVKGDVGNVRVSGYKEIVLDLVAEFGDAPIPEDMSFSIVGRDVPAVPMYGSFEYVGSYSAGIGMGLAYFSKWGAYAHFKFSFLRNEIGPAYWDYSSYETKRRYYRRAYTAGLVRMVYPNVIWVYGGFGYGAYAPVDKLKNVNNFDKPIYYWNQEKVEGLELEIGLMFYVKGVMLSVGYGSIAGEKMPFLPNLSLGVGYALKF